MNQLSPKKILVAFGKYFLRGKQFYIFTILWTFLLSVTVARIYGTYFSWYLFIKGYHIHHFFTGIFIISLGAISMFLAEKERTKLWLARTIGVGLGLVVDEIGLLLSCTTEGALCSYAYGDLLSSVSIIFWILIALIILVELPHDILISIRAKLDKESS